MAVIIMILRLVIVIYNHVLLSPHVWLWNLIFMILICFGTVPSYSRGIIEFWAHWIRLCLIKFRLNVLIPMLLIVALGWVLWGMPIKLLRTFIYFSRLVNVVLGSVIRLRLIVTVFFIIIFSVAMILGVSWVSWSLLFSIFGRAIFRIETITLGLVSYHCLIHCVYR